MSSEIASFYSGKIFLITGGTGFLGTCLVEKILRCCEDVAKIILIVRAKKYQDWSPRYKNYFNEPIFDKLKEDGNGTFQSKVQFIAGDMSKKNLGLKTEDKQMIINNVNIIVNAAATVKFTEELKLAIETNLRSVQEIICLAKQVKHLQAFVHVSSAFIDSTTEPCVLPEEFICAENVDYKYLLNLVNTENNETINKLCPKILQKYVNTYVLTKNAAEQLIKDQKKDLPLAVFRPALVMSAVAQPAPGWTNSNSALFTHIMGVGLGVIRLIPRVPIGNAQVVPVDMCASSILAIGWEIAKNPNNYHEVYNLSSNNCDIKTTKMLKLCSNYPFKNGIGSPWYTEIEIPFDKIPGYLHLHHVLPAMLYDGSLMLQREKPRFQKFAEICNSVILTTLFYLSTDFTFINKNLERLQKKLNSVDQTLFDFDIQSVNWDTSLRDMSLGVEKYLVKEKNKMLSLNDNNSKL